MIKLIYWRHHSQEEEEYEDDDLLSAFYSVISMHEYGNGAFESVTQSDGTVWTDLNQIEEYYRKQLGLWPPSSISVLGDEQEANRKRREANHE